MKAKQNFRIILVAILAIMMVSFAFLTVACNNPNNPGGDSSNITDSNTGDTGSTGGDSSTGGSDKPLEIPEGYKEVKATLNLNELADAVGKIDADINKGVFTIQVGAEVRTRTRAWSKTAFADYTYLNTRTTLDGKSSIPEFTHSMKLANGAGLKVKVPGDGYLSLYIQNGSSGANEQKITVNGTEVTFPGNNHSSPVVQYSFEVKKGEYVVGRPSGTVDLFMAELYCVALDVPATGITVAANPQTSFLAGQEFNYNGLTVGLNYEDGSQEALLADQYTVDSSAVDMTKPGKYNVNITYKANDKFSCSYEVLVSEIAKMEVGTYATEKVANSSAGNGVYFNQSVKTVYAVGEALDTKYITVNAYDTNGVAYLFENDNAAVSYTDAATGAAFSSATAGNYTINVTLTLNGVAKTGSYEVVVTDAALAKTAEMAYVYVDGTYTGVNGAAAVPAGLEASCNQFKTIEMALEFLKIKQAELGTTPVTMYIAKGTYKEKLEIEVPNLTMVGLGATNDEVLIEWDSLYGVNDASGYSQVTDSTQTVAVRESAVNCTMQNLTISNYWNSVARFNERADSATCDHRALALLVQADKFIMDNCKLLGYQDTIELFYGRQLIKNTFIAGTTDFIFGINNTTYFYKCEIRSIANAKAGQQGYITAFKGCNKGEADSVLYGAIFDRCNFTAEDATVSSAIGRCWGAYAAVAVINSEIGAHVSKDPYTGAKGERYISMNAKPTDATVKFVEYNNTGAGAVNETIAGMTYLDATTAANYSNLAVIFGATNGNVTYADAWLPTANIK